MTVPRDGEDEIAVTLLEVPVSLWAALDGEWKDRMREFALISLGERTASSVPARLLELVHELEHRYGALGEGALRVLEAAHAAGEATVARLDYLIPRHLGPALAELSSMMDETDAFCAEGEYLLSLASSPGSKALREWIFTEFAAQLDGAEATPWPESRFAAEVKELAQE